MSHDKLKAIRGRMARPGEPYAVARRAVITAIPRRVSRDSRAVTRVLGSL